MPFVSFLDESNATLNFYPLEDHESLPFPLNHHPGWKIGITVMQLTTFIFGLKLRATIFAYLLCPESKLGPINVLIWVDQVNGIFLAMGIALRMMAINLPFPLSHVFGNDFCKWIGLPGCIHLCGSIFWSCLIAIYR
jgi:hypothetical protein